eukprot:5229592-Ditylum_brightwellii.AAC.1
MGLGLPADSQARFPDAERRMATPPVPQGDFALQPGLLQAEEVSSAVCKMMAHLLTLLAIIGSDAISIEAKSTEGSPDYGHVSGLQAGYCGGG